jgi:hypothetical protein
MSNLFKTTLVFANIFPRMRQVGASRSTNRVEDEF